MFRRRNIELFTLIFGDIVAMIAALWLSLGLRNSRAPSAPIFYEHLTVFIPIFILWILGFIVYNLYGKRTVAFERDLALNLFKAQLFNSGIAAVIFYLIPQVGIAPKTILFMDLFLSFIFLLVWRTLLSPTFDSRKTEQVLLLGDSPEAHELSNELTLNPRYGIKIYRERAVNRDNIYRTLNSDSFSSVIFDFRNSIERGVLSDLGIVSLINLRFVDINKLYEDIFDRVPLSLVRDDWFFGNLSKRNMSYDMLKRLIDIILAMLIGIVSLIFYPLVYIAIKIEDKGEVFILQERIGKDNKLIKLLKFRTMTVNDSGVWAKQGNDSRVTKVGRFLRASRIDELPQIWSVLRGELSLIGPRPDIIDLGKKLALDIPYYTVRNIIKPGLSGWAQINQDSPPRSLEETKERLSYDFYYLKHRSFWLDLRIVLRTVKTLLSRSGL
ncbi:MAG: sugar transferase [Candidatus Vogelbacteria bacterium]|nr:sugar transferase [Candidatus Vogelbacteria bacterium]